MATLERAIAIAVEAHKGQTDKAGAPYILHPLRVMMRFTDSTKQIMAVLHDVVEDSPISLDDLRHEGFSDDIITGLDALTRRHEETYEAFVDRASKHPHAIHVKLADIEDNMDIRRLASLDDRAMARLQRYQQAHQRLTALLEQH